MSLKSFTILMFMVSKEISESKDREMLLVQVKSQLHKKEEVPVELVIKELRKEKVVVLLTVQFLKI